LNARAERLLLVLAPFAALAAVGVGLRVGASDSVRAAIVYSAPVSKAGTGLAWQVVAFEIDHGVRAPLVDQPLEVTARAGDRTTRWIGATNEDGVAEVLLPLVGASDVVGLEVRAGGHILAVGEARVPLPVGRSPVWPVWMPFARREGAIVLDVAVLGQRVAPGLSATLWVRATDASSRARLPGVAIEPETDASLVFPQPSVRTAANGWAELTATAAGLAISLTLSARTADGRTGKWQGGLFSSPGAVKLETRRRWATDESVTIAVLSPTAREAEYLEIDDASGRAWGSSVAMVRGSDGTASASVSVPSLHSGLYWAVAASDAAGATLLGPGTATLPFFVAANDSSALALGTDGAECAEPQSADEAARALGPCLAVAAAIPVARWTALDGLARWNGRLRERRFRGIAVSASSVLFGMALEAILLIRAAARGRKRGEGLSEDLAMSPPLRGAVAVLVALLGFALIAAFVLRSS
jgi:hypothetical protein